MTIYITPEITKAFDAYLGEEVDWDFVGKPITRRMVSGIYPSIVDYAAGWQASRRQALEQLSTIEGDGLGKPAEGEKT